MFVNLPYGVPFVFVAPIPKADDTAFAASGDWTPASGDVKVTKDGGDVANIGTLPSAVGGSGSVLWKWTLSAAEMAAREIVVQVVDAAVENQAFVLRTREALASGQLSSQSGAGTGEVYVPDTAISANDQFIGSIYREYNSSGALVGYGIITDSVEDSQDKLVLNGGATLWWTPTSGNYFTIEEFGVAGVSEAQLAGAILNATASSYNTAGSIGEAINNAGTGGENPSILVSTTIASLSSQTSFTLTAGSGDNDAYNGAIAVITDQSTSTQKAVGIVSDYVGSTKTVTLAFDPGIFTMAEGDSIDIIAAPRSLPAAAPGASGGLVTGDANNRIAGIQGTITTLDALDTAQDSQHGTTQGSVTSVGGAVEAVGALVEALGTLASGIKAKTDNLPASPAAVGSAMTLADSAITGSKIDATARAALNSMRKNVAYAMPPFKMKLTGGGSGTGLAVSAQISKDGGAFAPVSSEISEIGESGWYKLDTGLTQSEMNANSIVFVASAEGCDDFEAILLPQPT